MTGPTEQAAHAARWQRVKQVFDSALDLTGDDLRAHLDAECGSDEALREEVLSLLDANDDAGTFLEDAAVDITEPSPVTPVGRKIGPYQLQSLLGQGGMGEVYLSTREVDGYPMQVALKLIRHSAMTPRSLRRFRLERQILARLHHAGITSLLDGGITDDGVPFLVTEFVDGTALDKSPVPEAMTLAQRLEMFLAICDAVSFAHRHLVVHGDLKPGNILVTADGKIKLLDFGISRLMQTSGDTTEQRTGGTTQLAMTPAWTSPEQLIGEQATIASDVYSLGRVLYFLLCRHSAIPIERMTPMQLHDALKLKPIEPPSRWANDGDVEGDLDNIAAKALEFEPADRYVSVDALAEDIRAHLTSRPISARPHTRRYRLQKFVRRNRAGVIGAVAVLAALVIGLGLAMWQARIAQRNYERAERRFQELRRLASNLISETDDALARLPGATPARAALVRSSLEYLDGLADEAKGDPRLQEELANAYEKTGDVQGRPGTLNLGQINEALQSYRKAESIRRAVLTAPAPDAERDRREEALANTLMRIGSILRATGDAQAALEADRGALEMRRKLLDRSPNSVPRLRNVASSLTAASTTLSTMGAFRGVLELRGEALTVYEQLVKTNPSSEEDRQGLALAHVRMGSILVHEKEYADALKHYRQQLEIQKQLRSAHPGQAQFEIALSQSYLHLGNAQRIAGDAKAALQSLLESQRIIEPFAAADPNEVRSRTLLATARHRIAQARADLGQTEEASRSLRAVLEERRLLSERNPANAGARGEVAETLSALADVAMKVKRREDAARYYQGALDIFAALKKEGRSNFANEEEVQRINGQLAAIAKRKP